MSILAVTGGTGFVGGRLLALAIGSGHAVRALTRRPQPARPGLTWIAGALDAPDALARLVEGADAVVHVAGIVNAPDRAGFAAGNIAGTRAIVDAATAGGVGRFIHVSSLAAREPGLSDYGWSKAGAEQVVAGSGLAWTMVRPPAIYGPGDMEMRDMFRVARLGLALLPPPGRMSVIEVGDLARLLLALVATDPGRVILEADDGMEGGWTHDAFARAIGAAVGRRVLPLPHAPRAPGTGGAGRPAGARREGKAHAGPGRLFLPSRLDHRSIPPPRSGFVAAGRADCGRTRRDGRLVPGERTIALNTGRRFERCRAGARTIATGFPSPAARPARDDCDGAVASCGGAAIASSESRRICLAGHNNQISKDRH